MTLRALIALILLAAAAGPAVANKPVALGPDHPLLVRIAAATVERGREHRAILVHPIVADAADPAGAFQPLSAAAARRTKDFTACEPDQKAGRETIEIFNWGAKPVLVLTGELFDGGLRDRAARAGVLLGPTSRAVLPVRPVDLRARDGDEAGVVLQAFGAIAPGALRHVVLMGAGEAALRDRIQKGFAAAGLKSDRGSVLELHAAKVLADRIDAYRTVFEAIPHESGRKVVGAACFVGERFVGIDLFDTNAAFREHWPTILSSLALEGALYETEYGLVNQPFPAGRDPDRRRAETKEMLKRIFGARAEEDEKLGTGERIRFGRDALAGSAILFDGKLVHAAILSDPTAVETPEPGVSGGEVSLGELERREARGTLTEAEKRLLERMRGRRPVPPRLDGGGEPGGGGGSGGGGPLQFPPGGGLKPGDPLLPGR